ncbi:MAG: DNA-protecting protein DprA [Bacteroidetes bacterium]|nr:MAG: DNA-protecting protein DprA [Bacteroidota bacterium]
MDDELLYLLSLSLVPQIGPVGARNLIAYCGSASAVFKAKQKELSKIPGIGPKLSEQVLQFKDFSRAERELEYVLRNGVELLRYTDEAYPRRLKRLADAPLLLFFRGNANLNPPRTIGIVGTRKCTEYGKDCVKHLVEDIEAYGVQIISGLAFGIDIQAHRSAVKHHISNIGVVAHGLDRIYPGEHKSTVKEMELNGGLLTEFFTGTKPDKENFPSRNRIVAGLCDALIVVESAKKGGAMITADIAFSYNRDVYAYPGEVGKASSEGTHFLIKTQKAGLIENAADLAYFMGWDQDKNLLKQTILPLELSQGELALLSLFDQQRNWDIDSLNMDAQLSAGEVALNLLELEMKGLIRSLPGKQYEKT